MGAWSSSTKNWGWAVSERRCFYGLTIPAQGPVHPRCKGSCQGVPNRLASSLYPCFVRTFDIWYCATHSASSLYPCFVRTFDIWYCATHSASQLQVCELSGPTFRFTTQEFSMVGGYMENLEKPQNCQNLGVGACLGQYGKCMISSLLYLLS